MPSKEKEKFQLGLLNPVMKYSFLKQKSAQNNFYGSLGVVNAHSVGANVSHRAFVCTSAAIVRVTSNVNFASVLSFQITVFPTFKVRIWVYDHSYQNCKSTILSNNKHSQGSLHSVHIYRCFLCLLVVPFLLF